MLWIPIAWIDSIPVAWMDQNNRIFQLPQGIIYNIVRRTNAP